MAITIETIHSQLASALTMMASPAFTNMGVLEQRQTKDGMVANVVQSINHIEMMTLDDANALRPSIENALFSAEQQGRMMHAAVSSAMLGRARGMAHLATQTLLTPMEYLTQNDWITMQEGATLGAVEGVAVKRFNKVGVDAPAEKTVQAISACVASTWWKDTLPTGHEAYTLCVSVKGALRRIPLIGPRGPPVYPPNPTGLPGSLRAHAYDHDDPPVSRPSSRFYLMKAHMVLRRSNSALRPNGPQAHTEALVPAAAAMDPMAGLMQMLRLAAPLMQQSPETQQLGSDSNTGITLRLLNRGGAQRRQNRLALDNGSATGVAGGQQNGVAQGLVFPAQDAGAEAEDEPAEETLKGNRPVGSVSLSLSCSSECIPYTYIFLPPMTFVAFHL